MSMRARQLTLLAVTVLVVILGLAYQALSIKG
jgi:hypothetical protein